jgi:trigger factor
MDRKYADVRRTVELKGFRKGHAPLNMIKTIYGDRVKADVVEKLIKDSYPNAVRENSLKVASAPTVTTANFTDEGAFTYTAKVEVLPEIDKINYDGLEVKTLDTDATDEEVDAAVQHYRVQYSELRPLSREAGENDVLIADLHKIADSKLALDQSEFPDSQIDLANPLTLKEFKEQLPGVRDGDVKEVAIVYPDDYSDPSFAGARITYHCEIKSVNERLLPEFDDEFARRTGLAQTALELKLKFREDLKRRNQSAQRRVHRQEIARQVCQKNGVPIPEGLVNEYLDSMIADARRKSDDVNEDEIRRKYRSVGEEALRWDLLWHTLAEQEKIEVLPADTENLINSLAAQNGVTPDEARTVLNKSGRLSHLRESILEEKVLDFLIDKAEKVPVKKQDTDVKER